MTTERFVYLCNVLWPRLLASPAWQRMETGSFQCSGGQFDLAQRWKHVTGYYNSPF